jgi:hypothetical protein
MVVYRICGCVLLMALLTSANGCGSSSSSSGGSSMDEMAGAVDAQNAARQQEEAAAATKAAEAQKAAESQPVEPQIENVTAHSMKKGKKLEGGGYLSAVTGARFWAEHQLILDNILHAMQLYQAEHGFYPKTQEQFMKEIIEPNEPATKLPELPEGWEYFYDPKDPLQLKMINKGGGNPTAVE